MKIVAISDTHLMHMRHPLPIPDGDVLVHAGDGTFSGKPSEMIIFSRWFLRLPHKHKVLVAGNHDWMFQLDREKAESYFPGVHYLQDSGVEIDGVKFWGSPWQPWFLDWAFNLQRGEPLREKWALIPEGTDVLVTHGPPYGVGDWVQRGERVGCEELRQAVIRVAPKLHIFGHIHGGYGVYESPVTKFVNASICDESYAPTNEPIVLDIANH